MRKEIRYSDMNSVGNVLDSMIQTTGLKKGVKISTLFKFWTKVAGKKFESLSRAEALLANDILLVACANSYVTSELTMFKKDLLKKIQVYAEPLGIQIEDIRFSHKIWKNTNSSTDTYKEPPNPHVQDLTGFDPDEIELEESEISGIRENVEKNTFASPEQRERMFRTIVLDLKIQKFLAQRNSSGL